MIKITNDNFDLETELNVFHPTQMVRTVFSWEQLDLI